MKTKQLIYLATPYSSNNPYLVEKRFLDITYVCGILLKNNEIVFSPITQCHPIKHMIKLPGEWEFWKNIDKTFLLKSEKMYILNTEGWDKSIGVLAEIEIARNANIPIYMLDFNFSDNTYKLSLF